MHHLRSALLGALLLVVARMCAAQDVRLMVCGREVEPPGTTAVSDGLLIAPLKAPLEAFGAAVALGADGRHIEVTLADGRAATLEVGGSTLTIDGVKRRLKRPVRLVGGVSVGPVADVLAALGADVRWDNETKTLYASARIRSVDVEGDESGVAVRIVTSAPVAFDAPKRLLDPPRLYVDVRGASGPFEGDSRVVGVAGVKRVRWARHSADPPSVRVVLDLERPMEPTWMVGRERMSARLAVGAPSAGAAALASEMAKVIAVETFAYDNGAADVVALLDKPARHAYDVMRKPLRIVVDFPDAIVGTGDVSFPGDGRLLHGVRLVSAAEDGHARLVLDMDYLMAFRMQEAHDPPRVAVRFQPGSLADRLIVVDPGHGGTDPGAMGRWLREKDINLDVAARVSRLLLQRGACALMTRTTDCYFPLYDRPRLANSVGADIFVSIHHNAAPRRNRAAGTETYYWRARDKCLATMIHEQMIAALGRKDNGVRRGNYAVLRESRMPAVLCEIGYVNYDEEESLLRDVGFRQLAARAIFEGLRGYVEGPPLWPQGVSPRGEG